MGQLDQLQRLAALGNVAARGQYVEALLEHGEVDEAFAFLRPLAYKRTSRRGPLLAELLAKHHRIAELRSRTVSADRFCAEQLVLLARQNKISGSVKLLEQGLS